MFRRLPLLMAALLFVDFIDEFSAGMPMVGIPGIEATFTLDYTTAAFLVFTLPQLVSFVLEPPLFLLADRFPKKLFVVGGLFGMALCDLAIGLSNGLLPVAIALALSGTASGCGVSLSQATLMDRYPDARARLMTRWTLMGALGDLAAPALFLGLATIALGWREAFLTTAALVAVYALVLALTDFRRAPSEDAKVGPTADEDQLGFRAALALAFSNRRLLLWLAGAWLCSLLDELLVAFGALFIRDDLGADAQTLNAMLLGLMFGGLVGLLVLDRILARYAPCALLKSAAIGCAICYATWLSVNGAFVSALCLFGVGLFSAPLYPIAKAQAYQAIPGHSGLVNALGHAFTPLDLLLPIALGVIADRFGLVWALAVLIAQPLGLLAIASSRLAAAPLEDQASRIG
jgi:MFS family permease